MEDVQCAIRLITCIKKHPILYDPGAEGYHSRTEQEKAWVTVADEIKESVSTCREKWKNLRASLSRHLRHELTISGRRKKPYYLAKHMDFVIPFTKSRKRLTNNLDVPHKEEMKYGSEESESDEDTLYIDESALEDHSQSQATVEAPSEPETHPTPEDVEIKYGPKLLQQESTPSRKRPNKSSDPLKITAMDCIRSKYYEELGDPDLNFFRSLLPDVRQMNRSQKNKLKMTIIGTIEQIMCESPPTIKLNPFHTPFSEFSSSSHPN